MFIYNDDASAFPSTEELGACEVPNTLPQQRQQRRRQSQQSGWNTNLNEIQTRI
jgi:hypothetical protein